jgi:hypothetical protein
MSTAIESLAGVQRRQIHASLVVTAKFSFSCHITYFVAVVAALSVGSEKKLEKK